MKKVKNTNIVSIEIERDIIRLVYGHCGSFKIKLKAKVTIPIPEHSIQDGRILDHEAVAGAIRAACKMNNIKTNHGAITVNARHGFIREIELPMAKPKELAQIAHNEILNYYNGDEPLMVQYKSVNDAWNRSSATGTSIYQVAALEEGFVKSYYELMKNIGCKNVWMDIQPNAIEKLCSFCNEINNYSILPNSVILADLNGDMSKVYVISSGKTILFRQLSLKFQQLQQADETYENEGTQHMDSEFDSDAVRLLEEIRNIKEYISGHAQRNLPERVFLFGKGSMIGGLADYLTEGLGMQVQQISSLANVEGALTDEELPEYLNAIGSMIRYSKGRRS